MCGRFVTTFDPEMIQRLFDLSDAPEIPERYNVTPTQPIYAVRMGQGGVRESAYLQWGLIPSWAKDMSMGARMINARSETVAEKPSFKAAFKRRRCIVPITGFYEWQKVSGGKQPHFIRSVDGEPLALAAIWEVWTKGEEAYIESCALLTTDANETLAPVHHRMPVILDPDVWDIWLDPALEKPSDVLPLLGPCPDEQIEAYPVSRYVNSPRNDDAKCIEPEIVEPPRSLF
ncbi:MAG: SOS response-associated peptidase [Candidatus Poribacteria bacterium]